MCGHLGARCVKPVQDVAQVQYAVHGVPTAEVAEKAGSKLLGRQEYAKRVALDLYRFMEARTTCCACCCSVAACFMLCALLMQ